MRGHVQPWNVGVGSRVTNAINVSDQWQPHFLCSRDLTGAAGAFAGCCTSPFSLQQEYDSSLRTWISAEVSAFTVLDCPQHLVGACIIRESAMGLLLTLK